MIRFTVPAVPVAQPRHKIGPGKNGGFPRAYLKADHPVHAFKALCAIAASKAFADGPLTGPLNFGANFIMPRPKGMTTKRGPNLRVFSEKKPDIDNLAKSLWDGVKGIAFVDDSQVAVAVLRKTIAAADESPRVECEVFPLTKPTGEST